jgi:hypothetical protein
MPTLAEQGLAEFKAWRSSRPLAGEVVDRLNGVAGVDLRDEHVRKPFLELGLELPDEAVQTPTALRELGVQ